MGIGVLIIGKSGSGKSTSLRNFKKEDVGIINVIAKPLPFKNVNELKTVDTDNYVDIKTVLTSCKTKSIVWLIVSSSTLYSSNVEDKNDLILRSIVK